MRSMIQRAVVFVCLTSAAFASVSISGNLKDLTGTAVASRTFVRFTIRGCNGNQPRKAGTAIIVPSIYEFTPSAAGAISGTLYDSLTDIECGGVVGATWYGVTIFRDGKPNPEVPYNVTGATFNLNSALPNSTNPVVAAPTGDSTYARLDGLNQPFTGNITAPSFIGSLTGNASTATALAANGTNCAAGNYPLGVDASGNSENCTAVSAGGVTSVATTSPITGGTITTTGTIACATCVTSAASLTSGQLMAGAGSQASQVSNLSGDVTTSGALATTVAKIQGTTVSGTTGSTNVVFSGSPTIVTPTVASFANATHNHQNSAGGGTLAEAALALTDLTTNNSSTSNHGFLKKLDNTATHFMDGTGAWSAPAVPGAPAYCPNMPTTANRRTSVWMSTGSGTTGSWLGSVFSSNTGTVANHTSETSASVPSAPDYISWSSSASGGAAAGIATPASYAMGDTSSHKANLYACVRARIGSTSAIRVNIGFIDNAHHWPFTNQCQNSFFASSQTMAITYDTLNGDTRWGVVTDNGNATANLNLNLSSSIDNLWHWFEIVMDDSVPNAKFYYDGTLLSTETTKIPAAGQQFEFNFCSEATTTTAARIDVAQIVIQSNYP